MHHVLPVTKLASEWWNGFQTWGNCWHAIHCSWQRRLFPVNTSSGNQKCVLNVEVIARGKKQQPDSTWILRPLHDNLIRNNLSSLVNILCCVAVSSHQSPPPVLTEAKACGLLGSKWNPQWFSSSLSLSLFLSLFLILPLSDSGWFHTSYSITTTNELDSPTNFIRKPFIPPK